MNGIVAAVASQIILPKAELPTNILDEIRAALMMKNPARESAQKEQIGGWWNIPEYLDLYSEDETSLFIPRGFANQLVEGFKHYGLELDFADSRTVRPVNYDEYKTIGVRDYQESAINSMLTCEQGVWEAPPGAGKTVGVLEAIRRSGQRALVITDKTNIAEQWRLRAKAFLGADIGLLGNSVWDEMDITVALQQSLWARREQLQSDGWFDQWGFVCLDECHHLPANTFTEILSQFSAKYRIGVSGTPYKQPGQDDLIWNTLGPRLHVTDKHMLRKGGWLIKPEVRVWKTDFSYPFWPTHQFNKETGKCMFKYCTRPASKMRHQNNYSEMMTALVNDDLRNKIIATIVAQELSEGHCILVLSKRLGHLKTLEKYVLDMMPLAGDYLFQFTGKETTKRRMEIQDRAQSGRCVLFSTIADEALDIPRIDRIHLAWPTRNTDTTRQQIGRGERPFPGSSKSDTIINDYLDNVGPLRGQIADRVRNVYIPDGLTIRGWED